MMVELLQTLIFGLATGGIIALNALGLTLSYRIVNMINFSYGEFLTIGSYMTVFLVTLHVPLVIAAGLALLMTGLLGVIIAAIFFTPLKSKGFFPLLVTSVGIAFILQNSIRILAGSSPIRFPIPFLVPWSFGDIFIPVEGILVIVIALCVMYGVYAILYATHLGTMMRAVADDPELARISGIPIQYVFHVTWFLSAALGGLGGILLAVIQITLTPSMGFHFLLIVFAAVLLGGIGHIYGAVISGLVLGIVIEGATVYVSPDYGYAIAFMVLVVLLLFRPSGIFHK